MPTLLKNLELRWRRALLAAGHRGFSGRSTDRAEDLLQLPPNARILVIRLERIGDVLVGLPVIRSLRGRYPDARIELLVSRSNAAVSAAVAPFVDHVWVYDKTFRSAVRLLRALRRVRYDAIVDLIDHPSTTAQLVIRWCRPRAAVGLLHAESGLYTHAAPTRDPATVHPVERFAQVLLPFGIDPAAESLDLEYPLTAAEIAEARRVVGTAGPRHLGVNVSCRQSERAWGAVNYAGLIRTIMERHPEFEVFVCGAAQQAPIVEWIVAATGAHAIPPRATLSEFAAIVHEFDLLVTPDTVAVHLAAAWKIPTVALYHPEPGVAPWVPYHTRYRAVVGAPEIPAIPVTEVAAAVDALIAECFEQPSSA
ncbi:MAG: glycosyltransferase family 9 protein [Gemmatimonadales bacterium]